MQKYRTGDEVTLRQDAVDNTEWNHPEYVGARGIILDHVYENAVSYQVRWLNTSAAWWYFPDQLDPYDSFKSWVEEVRTKHDSERIDR